MNEQSTEHMPAAPKKRRLRIKSKKRFFLGLLIIAVLGFSGALYVNNKTLRKDNARLSNPQESAKIEADRLKEEVGKLIELPSESPTIATVVDANKLKEQAFFANAQNGDKVLLFAGAKKAVLYRPSTGKIIEVAPINIGGNTAGVSTEPAPQPKDSMAR